jgi:hypothetical protein
MNSKFPAIVQQNRQKVILVHETIPLNTEI